MIDDFLSGVARECPGAPDPVIESAILESAIHFCESAYVWVVDGLPQDIKAGVFEYFIQPPADGQVHVLKSVYVSGRQVPLVSRDELAVSAEPGAIQAAYITDENRLGVFPVPDQDISAGLVIKVVCRPINTAKRLPDVLFDRYKRAIEVGALAILKAMPGQSWSRQNDVSFHQRESRKLISTAKADKIRARHAGSVSVKRRRFC